MAAVSGTFCSPIHQRPDHSSQDIALKFLLIYPETKNKHVVIDALDQIKDVKERIDIAIKTNWFKNSDLDVDKIACIIKILAQVDPLHREDFVRQVQEMEAFEEDSSREAREKADSEGEIESLEVENLHLAFIFGILLNLSPDDRKILVKANKDFINPEMKEKAGKDFFCVISKIPQEQFIDTLKQTLDLNNSKADLENDLIIEQSGQHSKLENDLIIERLSQYSKDEWADFLKSLLV